MEQIYSLVCVGLVCFCFVLVFNTWAGKKNTTKDKVERSVGGLVYFSGRGPLGSHVSASQHVFHISAQKITL